MTRFFRENSAKLQTVSHLSIFHLMQQSSNHWDFFFLLFNFSQIVFTNVLYIEVSKKIKKKLYFSKAEFLQLNRTQFPSLGFFVSKKIGKLKKVRPLLLYQF